MPERFIYTAWFHDERMPDENFSASFIIEADDAEVAKEWGDTLASARAARTGEIFFRSAIEAGEDDSLPIVPYGSDAPAEEIGW